MAVRYITSYIVYQGVSHLQYVACRVLDISSVFEVIRTNSSQFILFLRKSFERKKTHHK